MNCKNCGHELSNEAKFCENCGMKIEAEAQDTEVQNESPITETPEEVKPKKSKKGLFIGIGIAAVIIIAVAIALPFVKKAVIPDDVYFKNAERATVEGAVDVVAEALDKFDEITADSTTDALEIYDSGKGGSKLSVTLGDGIVQYMSESAGADLSFLKQIDLGGSFALKDDMIALGLALGLENKQVISADTVIDLKDFIAYVTIPELNSTAIKLDLEELTGEELSTALEGMDSTVTQEALSIYGGFPEGKTVKSIVMRYLDIVLEHVKTVEKSEKTLIAGNVSQELTAYSTVLTPDELEALSVDVLTELKDDDELWNALETLCNALDPEIAENVRYSRDDLKEGYDDMVAEIDGTFDEKGALTYTAYIDSTGTIFGRHMAYDNGDELKLSVTADGNNSGFELELREAEADIAKFVLNITEKKEICHGDAVLSLEGNDMLRVDFKNVALDGSSAEMTFTPMEGSSEYLKAMSDNMEVSLGTDLEELGIDLNESVIAVRFDVEATDSASGKIDCETVLTSKGTQVFALSATTEYGEADELTIPKNNADVNGKASFMSWLYSSNILGFIGNLPDGLSTLLSAMIFAGMQ